MSKIKKEAEMLLLQLSRHPEYTAWMCHALVIYSSQPCWDGVTTQAKQVLHHTQARGEVPWQRGWKKSHFAIRITWAVTIPVPLHYDSSDKETLQEQHWLALTESFKHETEQSTQGQHNKPHCTKPGLWHKALPSDTSGFWQTIIPPHV